MNANCPSSGAAALRIESQGRRRDDLDATRAFALLLGVVFHASLSFVPVYMGWAVQDVSTSAIVSAFTSLSHSFRMELFFLLAGFLGRASCERSGISSFLKSRLVRIGLPFLVGWFVVRPLLVSGWVMGSASLRGDVDVVAALWAGVASLAGGPQGWWTGTHLWFLYYLLQVSLLWALLRGCVRASRGAGRGILTQVDRLLSKWGSASWAPWALAIPTALILGRMQSWGVDTPDRSLLPHLPTLSLYFACFGFGWLLQRQEGSLERWSEVSVLRIVWAVAGAVLVLALGQFERDPAHEWHAWMRGAHALGYGVLMWSLVFLTLGVFRRMFPRERTGVRYLADASYWIYLVHLPIVVWLQVAVSEWPGHWTVKLAGISMVTLGIALLTYDLFVRSTVMGLWLNGKRRERVLFSRRIHARGVRSPVESAPAQVE